MASLQRYVPTTCSMKFNKLNFVRHLAGTNYPPNWWNMYLQHFYVCANVVIFSLLHVPATRFCHMSPQCALHKFFVAARGGYWGSEHRNTVKRIRQTPHYRNTPIGRVKIQCHPETTTLYVKFRANNTEIAIRNL